MEAEGRSGQEQAVAPIRMFSLRPAIQAMWRRD